ncbi:AarF/ABC1/UbiB kinase family protein [Halobacillus kuroshimensis]|uniref:AarF/ABC1/UbiB kinase family protein n=1 Tax=Halobacillus kuroshimensis TaxID=302481 RepID=A0ABS3E0T6_9BACI|nr:AarF/UbiB family protein [Halobacillus kuroshimensis]MBN8237202.1 AarF/ABC1/UbiB kinase family protein [Halobacillus kuroshimensis]
MWSRLREIFNTFAKYGLTHLLNRFGFRGSQKAQAQSLDEFQEGRLLKEALEELGPVFIKLGQFLSLRKDLLSESWRLPLMDLQDQSKPHPIEDVIETLDKEFKQPYQQWLCQLDPIPLGTASLGQVHLATLSSGRKVAIKVKHVKSEIIEKDLEILSFLAKQAEKRSQMAATFRLVDVFQEFSESLRQELDYKKEGEAMRKLESDLTQEMVSIPSPMMEWTTEQCLTMEYVEGRKLSTAYVNHLGLETKKDMAQVLATYHFQQIFIHGRFHADLHPGNLLYHPDKNKIFIIDFGNIGYLSPSVHDFLKRILMSLYDQDSYRLAKDISELPREGEMNFPRLHKDMDRWLNRYIDLPVQKLSLGEMFYDLFELVSTHHFEVPSALFVVGQSLLKLEYTIQILDPELNLEQVIHPIGEELIKAEVENTSLSKNLRHWGGDMQHLFLRSPQHIHSIMKKIDEGSFQLKFGLKPEEKLVKRIEKMVNRVVLSVIMLAFSLMISSVFVGLTLSGNISSTHIERLGISMAIVVTAIFCVVIGNMWWRRN